MSRFTLNRPARQTGRTRARLAAGLTASTLAVTAVLGQAGCQNAGTRGPTASPQSPKTAFMPHPRGGEAPQAKTNFKSQATPSQGYNVHLELGRAMESQGNYEAAVTEYQKAVDLASNRGSAKGGAKLTPEQLALGERRLAAALDRMGRFTQAEGHYRKALALAPEDPKVWNNCGYSYYLQCRYDDAERALKTADKFDPGDPLILNNLGLAQAANGKVEEGLANLTRASGPAVAHANLAYVLASTGKKEDARAHYQKALELQPDLVVAREAAARLDTQLAKAGVRMTPVSAVARTPSPDAPGTPRPSGDPAVAVTSAATPAAPKTVAPVPLPPLPEGFDTPARGVGGTKPISITQPPRSAGLAPESPI